MVENPDENNPVQKKSGPKLFRPDIFFLFLLVFRLLYHFFLLPEPILCADSYSYLSASENRFIDLLHGRVDLERTPFYPLFIEAIRWLFGMDNALLGVVFVQRFLSFAGVCLFFLSLSRLLKNRIVIYSATFYFACSPCILSYNASILTESLSISFIVFLFYCFSNYLERPRILSAITFGLSIFFLVMLRPAFVFWIPIFLLFWSVRLFYEKRTKICDGVGLAATFLSVLLLLGYCQLFKQNYGVFHLSIISSLNQFHIVIQSGIYRQGPDLEINRRIQEDLDAYVAEHPKVLPGPRLLFPTGISEEAFDDVAWKKRESYANPPARMAEYARTAIRNHPLEFTAYSFGKAVDRFPQRFCQIVTPVQKTLEQDWSWSGVGLCEKQRPTGAESLQNNFEFDLKRTNFILNALFGLPMRYGLVYILLFIDLFVLLIAWRRKREPPYVGGFLWLGVSGMFFTALVGAQCDWSRLVLPSLPLLIVLLAVYAERLTEVCKSKLLTFLPDDL